MSGGWGKVGALIVPALTAYDWQWGLALCFGIVSGWFCRAAIPYMDRKPWTEIRREIVVSVMISGGTVVSTLYIARHLEADALGVGALAWAISFGGLKSLSLAYEYVLRPIKHAIGKSPDELMAERNQEAQKLKAAAMQAAREIEKEEGRDK